LKLGILVVAYNAEKTITSVISRIPKNLHNDIHSILISDDYSTDATYEISKDLGRNSNLPITVFRQPKNLGYGGNQKFGYQWAIDNNLELVVLLHGDGQYAPEYLSNILNPLIQDEADVVFGSRMILKGGALKGGMPYYKFIGNKILTFLQNRITYQNFSEWHSGYRAYRVSFLSRANLFELSNGFRFDTQIILKMIQLRARIIEVPIPTFYGEEVSRVNGILYAFEILYDTLKFKYRK
jgi:glycosyltransferase involved in cell wall biosynthesis